MRIVVDTNVFVSAALKKSSWPSETVRWVANYGRLLKSHSVEKEIFDLLRRPRIAPKIEPSFLRNLARLFAAAELVAITETLNGCRDPNDDKFLELAVNGRADVIVSGDNDLLILDEFRGIPIVTPAAFARAKLR